VTPSRECDPDTGNFDRDCKDARTGQQADGLRANDFLAFSL
jgi:hypothetical protein